MLLRSDPSGCQVILDCVGQGKVVISAKIENIKISAAYDLGVNLKQLMMPILQSCKAVDRRKLANLDKDLHFDLSN